MGRPKKVATPQEEEGKELPADDISQDEKRDETADVMAKMLLEVENKLLGLLSELSARIDKLENMDKSADKPKDEPKELGVKLEELSKCPQDIRDLVSKKISPKCAVRIEDSKTSPTFTIHITLPPELQSQENDIRSKTVKYSEGINGVSEWLDKVKINIWNTFKSRGESVPLTK